MMEPLDQNLLSALAGIFFGGLNLYLVFRIVSGLLAKGNTPRGKMIRLFVFKYFVLFGIIGLILTQGYVTALPLLAGFTVSLVIGLVFLVSAGSRGGRSVDPTLKE